jgi:hypothetical protein
MKVSAHPVGCQRLPNGNTFIATYTTLLELDRGGKEVYSIPSKDGSIYCARKLPDGSILCIDCNCARKAWERRKDVGSTGNLSLEPCG